MERNLRSEKLSRTAEVIEEKNLGTVLRLLSDNAGEMSLTHLIERPEIIEQMTLAELRDALEFGVDQGAIDFKNLGSVVYDARIAS